MKPLTDRQERFIFEYTFDQNATAAAGRAGYSDKTKGTHAAQMMKNPQIRERIVAELGDLFTRLKFNATFLLQSQINAAFLDPAKLFDAQEQPIALDKLDKETRDGLTVTYSKRRNGDYTMRVKQTPRHIALAVLQKRIDAFKKLEGEVFALEVEEEEVAPVVVPPTEQQILWPEATSSGARSAQNDSGGDAEVRAKKAAAPSSSPLRIAQAIKNWLKLDFKLAEPMEKLVQVKTAIAQAVQAIGGKREPDIALLWGSLADFAASQPVDRKDPPPPSPYEPGYNFKKDPNAIDGGRYGEWIKYWTEKRNAARHQAEKEAAHAAPPPNMRVRPGMVVPGRMEPGYNSPWHRDNRPRFAIGAGETYLG
ncbi:MAG: Terminase small subunit [Bradyrhizobium sp.]|nr:Terminase small subunit [Bradyrhizobium sp.]